MLKSRTGFDALEKENPLLPSQRCENTPYLVGVDKRHRRGECKFAGNEDEVCVAVIRSLLRA